MKRQKYIYFFKNISENFGFSLIELLAILSIIAVVFAVSVQFLPKIVEKESIDDTENELEKLRVALVEYYRDTNIFPAQLRDLETDPGVSGWDGPYIRSGFEQYDYEKDGWGEDYIYSYTIGAWGNDPCTLYGKGPNKQDDSATGDDISVNPGASNNPEQVSSAVIKKQVEREVRKELDFITQKGQNYDSDNPGQNFPTNIDVLYLNVDPDTSVYYLTDESYRWDKWGNKYFSADIDPDPHLDAFLSRGPDGISGTGDDISP